MDNSIEVLENGLIDVLGHLIDLNHLYYVSPWYLDDPCGSLESNRDLYFNIMVNHGKFDVRDRKELILNAHSRLRIAWKEYRKNQESLARVVLCPQCKQHPLEMSVTCPDCGNLGKWIDVKEKYLK